MKNLVYTIIILGAIATSGCTKIIELDLNNDENKRLVVDAIFTTYPLAHEVKLSLTSNYFSADAPAEISGATVSVTDGTTTIPFNEVSPGIYRTADGTQAVPETNYTLSIDYEGKTYTAETFCNTSPPLDSILIEPNVEDDTLRDYKVRFSTQEKPGFGDYYAWKIYINGVLYNDTITEQISTPDEFLPDGQYFYLLELTSIDEADLESGDTVMVAQHAITKETYDIYQAILQQTVFRGGIFDTPPADIPTNLTEGAVGMFSASGETRNFGIVP